MNDPIDVGNFLFEWCIVDRAVMADRAGGELFVLCSPAADRLEARWMGRGQPADAAAAFEAWRCALTLYALAEPPFVSPAFALYTN